MIAIGMLVGFLSAANAVFAAELPRAQLDESERHFTKGYMHFLKREYWDTLNELDRALKVNTYLVDYYLLKGLTMSRLGDIGAAREALAYYLEVRPLDTSAPRILTRAVDVQRELRRILSPSHLSSRWSLFRPDLQNEFQLGYFRPFNVRGAGKADAFNSFFCLPDTLGDRFYFRGKSAGKVVSFPLKRPVATLAMGDGTFYVAAADGNVYSFDVSTDTISPDLRGTLDCTVADAVLLSAGECAVADPVRRETVFCSLELSGEKGAWSPPSVEGDMLFEPVALAAYGPWLAVADRGNERIFFLNVANRQDFFSVDVPRPRDLCWSAMGELFVISEEGSLYRMNVDFRDRWAEAPVLLESGLTDGWTLFRSDADDMYCLDIGASALWKAVPVPDAATSSGFLSISLPMIVTEKDRESFVMEASLMSPFVTYSHMSDPVVYTVWNNKMIPSTAMWRDDRGRKTDLFVFHRPISVGAVNPALKNMVAENGTDVQIVLPSIWTTYRETLTNVVLDSSVSFSGDELDILTLFCLNNGLELDIWGRSVPTVEMMRAAALTGGKVLYSLAGTPDLNPPRNRMQIRIPLPQDLASSGYTDRSMLTTYLDIGLMQTRDWIPLWPDLLEE